MKKRFKKIYIEVTNACNLNCNFCIKNERDNQFISIGDFKILLNRITNFTDYLYFHVLGEPLMHPRINKLIDIASVNFKVNITTNGYLINKIKDNTNIRQLNISLHSFNTSYKISLTDYLNNIFDSIDELIKNKTYISLRLWVKSIYNKEIIKHINKRYNSSITCNTRKKKINNYLFFDTFHEFVWPDLSNNIYESNGKCYGLIDHIGILVDGSIIPCCLDSRGDITLGNIYINNLDDALNSERTVGITNGFKSNKKVEELCKHCKFINKDM